MTTIDTPRRPGPLTWISVMLLAALAPVLAALLITAAAPALAAPVTVTKTPKVIYLFVAVTPPAAGKAPYVELYHTDDQAACDAQAADWSARMAPNKFACLPHNQDKLASDGGDLN